MVIIKGVSITILLVPLLLYAQGDDSCTVTGKKIIYFGPSLLESDSISNSEGSNEALNDFAWYIQRSDSALAAMNISREYSSCNNITIISLGEKKTMVRRGRGEFGFIFVCESKEPEVVRNVLTDEELVEEVDKYFGGCK